MTAHWLTRHGWVSIIVAKVPAVRPVVKLLRGAEWAAFEAAGRFDGSPDDLRDGYIHLSTPEQAEATRARHFAGESGLWQVTLDADTLGPALRWEVSRGGVSFPHLYRALEADDVVTAVAL